MSAYAASATDRKQLVKMKKSKFTPTSKVISLPTPEETISGLYIRRRTGRTFIFLLETFLALAFGLFVVCYVFGKKLVSRRAWNGGSRYVEALKCGSLGALQSGGPLGVVAAGSLAAITAGGGKRDSNSNHGISRSNSITESDYFAVARMRPPSCLEDPSLGVHKFIKIQGVKLHYVEAGAAAGRPLLLLLHGAVDFWFTWRRLVPALSRRFRVVCLDFRGCGDSEKPLLRYSYTLPVLVADVAALIHTLTSENNSNSGGVFVMGAGWGGQVAWALCHAHPHLVRKMVLVHSPHPAVLRASHSRSLRAYCKLWQLLFVRIPGLPEWAAAEERLGLVSKLLEPLIAATTTDPAITQEEVNAYLYNFFRAEDLTGALHHVRNWDPWNAGPLSMGGEGGRPSVLTTPTLLLMGDSDPAIPLEAGYRSAEHVERIKVRVLVGAGQWAQVTHAGSILEELAGFFNEPRILGPQYCSSEEDWDADGRGDVSSDDEEETTQKKSLMGRMIGVVWG